MSERRDLPQRLTALCGALLGDESSEWARAMAGELASLASARERWRFAAGCLVTAFVTAPVRHVASRRLVIVAAGSALTSAALVATAVVRYPGLVTGPGTWVALTFFLLVLLAYVSLVGVLARAGGATGARATLLGIVLVTLVWAGVNLWSGSDEIGYVSSLLLALVPATGCVAGVVGARGGASAGSRNSVLSGLLVGLVVFVGWSAITLAGSGRPYDAGQLRDFHGSGAPDLATYAVGDELGTAMVVLLLVPLVVGAVGTVASAVAARVTRSEVSPT